VPQNLPAREEEMAETHKVAIKAPPFAFDPNSLTVKVGDAVEWTNQTGMNHTVNPDKDEFPSSGVIRAGATFSHTFSAAGSVAYHCQIHPFMKGTVIVT
jgi:plastocyanin